MGLSDIVNGISDQTGEVIENLAQGVQSGIQQGASQVVVNYVRLGSEVKNVIRSLSEAEKKTYALSGAVAHNDLETLYAQRENVLRQKNLEIAAIDAQIAEKEEAMRNACHVAVVGTISEEIACDIYMHGNTRLLVRKNTDPTVASNIIATQTVQTDEVQPEQEMM
jgi:hypothetical protein